MSSVNRSSFMALLSGVVNEVLAEEGSPQRFNAEGKALRRTATVDPQYHKDLLLRRQSASDQQARLRVGSQSVTR